MICIQAERGWLNMSIYVFVSIIAVIVALHGIFIYNLFKEIRRLEDKLTIHTTRLNNQTDFISGILNKIEKDFYNGENKQ